MARISNCGILIVATSMQENLGYKIVLNRRMNTANVRCSHAPYASLRASLFLTIAPAALNDKQCQFVGTGRDA